MQARAGMRVAQAAAAPLAAQRDACRPRALPAAAFAAARARCAPRCVWRVCVVCSGLAACARQQPRRCAGAPYPLFAHARRQRAEISTPDALRAARRRSTPALALRPPRGARGACWRARAAAAAGEPPRPRKRAAAPPPPPAEDATLLAAAAAQGAALAASAAAAAAAAAPAPAADATSADDAPFVPPHAQELPDPRLLPTEDDFTVLEEEAGGAPPIRATRRAAPRIARAHF